MDADHLPSPTPKRGIRPRVSTRDLWTGLLLGLITLAVFWPAGRDGFTGYDDPAYVAENAHVQSGLKWENVVWAFTTGRASNWHPVTWLSHMLDCQLFGLQAGPQHLVSIGFHLANTLLLLLLLRRMTGAFWRSAMVAALFALHPLHVESVAWIAERKDVLSTFFFLLTLWAYARYAEKSMASHQWSVNSNQCSVISNQPAGAHAADNPLRTTGYGSLITDHRSLFYLLALAFFALGLMSKPMLVTLPCVLLLLDYWPLRRFQLSTLNSQLSTIFVEKLPFFALAAASSTVTFIMQQKGGAVSANLSLDARIANALVSYVRYIGKLFWPENLAAFYPHPGKWPAGQVVASAVLLLVVLAAVMRLARNRPYLAVGWLWFCGMLVPVIGLVQVGIQSMADRYTYVPFIGLFIMLVWGAHDVAARWRYRAVAWPAVALAIICLCLGLTHRQLGYWKDTESLLGHALAVTESNEIAHHNLGVALATKGDFDAAIRHFQEAVRLRPGHADAHRSLAQALLQKHRFAEAMQQYEAVLRLNPRDAGAHNDLGKLLAGAGRMDEAMQHYTEALRLNPNYPQAHFNLGLALAKRGAYREAAAQLQEVLRLQPNNASARQELNRVLAAQNHFEQAIGQYREAVRSKPGDARARSDLGRLLVQAGQADEAIEQFTEAARLDPRSAQIRYDLGVALARKGDLEQATGQIKVALDLDPNFAPAHYALGRIALLQRQTAGVLEHWRAAVRLNPKWIDPLVSLAWALATDPHPELRDGPEAVKLATRAAELAGARNMRILDILAAAYAEAGRFAEASATAREAQAAAAAQGVTDLAGQIQQRLALYEAHQPYREDPGAR